MPDIITGAIWSGLAAHCWVLYARLVGGPRAVWLVVALYCSVFAIDKVVDLQVAVYRAMVDLRDLLASGLGLRDHRHLVRVVLLLPGVALVVAGTLWTVRRDRPFDGARQKAMLGLLLVLVMVGVRSLPGLDTWFGEVVCWVIEGVAALMVWLGLRAGWRKDPVSRGPGGPSGRSAARPPIRSRIGSATRSSGAVDSVSRRPQA